MREVRAVRSRQQNCFGREFFGVPLTGVTRFQKAVAQVPVGTPLTAADNRHSHRSSRPAGVSGFGNPSGDRLTAIVCQLVRRGPAVVPLRPIALRPPVGLAIVP
jgi:hypothetical protein